MANIYSNNVKVQDYLKNIDWAIGEFTYSEESEFYAGEKGIFVYDQTKPFGEDLVCHVSKGIADFYYKNKKALPKEAFVGEAEDGEMVMHLGGTRKAASTSKNTKFI